MTATTRMCLDVWMTVCSTTFFWRRSLYPQHCSNCHGPICWEWSHESLHLCRHMNFTWFFLLAFGEPFLKPGCDRCIQIWLMLALTCNSEKAFVSRQPLVLPFYHSGMGRVLPKGSVVPRAGHDVHVEIGDPVDLTDVLHRCNCKGQDLEKVRLAQIYMHIRFWCHRKLAVTRVISIAQRKDWIGCEVCCCFSTTSVGWQ